MASAAIGNFVGRPTNATHIFDRKIEFQPNSNDIRIVFFIGETTEQRTLKAVVNSQGWQFEKFESAREFLARPRPLVPSCLILSFSLNCLEEQKLLSRERSEVPIIVVSRDSDVRTTVQVMKAGAVDFLLNPFSSTVLLEAIRESFERSRRTLDREMETTDLRNCYGSLTRRERQVMALVVSGLLNKQVGGELGISEITVKAHRGQVMQKMKANSLADLVRMASELEQGRTAIHVA